MKQRLTFITVTFAVLLALTGCTKSNSGALPVVSSTGFGTVPEITFPSGTPPVLPQFQVLDGEKSSGAVIADNDLIVVDYYARVWNGSQLSDSTITDSSGSTAISLARPPIMGWKQLVGKAKIGQRVMLVLPPDYAYGADGSESAGVGKDQTVVYVVDVRDRVSPSEAAKFQLSAEEIPLPAEVGVDYSDISNVKLEIGPGAESPVLATNYVVAKGNGPAVNPGESLACRILAKDFNGSVVLDTWSNQVLTRIDEHSLNAQGLPLGSLVLSMRPATADSLAQVYLYQIVGSFTTTR